VAVVLDGSEGAQIAGEDRLGALHAVCGQQGEELLLAGDLVLGEEGADSRAAFADGDHA
jgi:hypothetical protein